MTFVGLKQVKTTGGVDTQEVQVYSENGFVGFYHSSPWAALLTPAEARFIAGALNAAAHEAEQEALNKRAASEDDDATA